MGAGLLAASAVQGGSLPSWIGTTAVMARMVTTTANTNALTQGAVTFYITTERY
jgi:hypothetical protein